MNEHDETDDIPAPVTTSSSVEPKPAGPETDPEAYLGGYFDQFAQRGDLPDQAISEIAQRHGDSPAKVRMALDALKYKRSEELRAVYQEVGGQERAKTIFEWARNAPESVLSAARKADLGRLVQTGDKAVKLLAMRELAQAYDAAAGEGREVGGGRGTATGQPSEPTMAQSKVRGTRALLRSDRYDTDDRYQRDVNARMLDSYRKHGAF
jgi:hypothetical protein